MSDLPAQLNGHDVIRYDHHFNGYTTVLVRRGPHDFVVATWWPSLKTQWSWGHYFTDLEDATEDYIETGLRNYKRGQS